MERCKARDEKCAVSGAREVHAKVSKAQEGMRLWCVWAHESVQVMREVGSSVGIHNEREVM
jgi:hypothetical protein